MSKLKTNQGKVKPTEKPTEKPNGEKVSGTDSTWIKYILAVVSVCSLVVAAFAYRHSEKALERTEELFFLENRPYLLISAHPFDDLKSYYFTKLDREDKSMYVYFQFEIKNIGKLAATDILFHGQMAIINKESGKTTISTEKKLIPAFLNPFISPGEISKIALAPGESQFITLPVPFSNIPAPLVEGLDKTFDTMVGESGLGLRIRTEYKNETDKNTIIRISKTYRVFKNKAFN